MSTLRRICKILFAASWCLVTTALAAPDTGCGERASLAELIASPDKYHGKTLWVVAYITIDFENMTACPSETGTQQESCLWLDISGSPKTDQDYARYESDLRAWNRFNLQTVGIRAVFDKGGKGHFSMWPGSLRGVTEVSGYKDSWSFASSATVPRTACVGELPVPEESSGRRLGSGNLKLRNGDYDGAIADFDRAIELEPGNSMHYLMRGNAKKQKRDYGGTIADYTRAIEFEREYKDVMYSARADARELNGDFDGAIADYTRAIEIDPKFDGTYRSRGRVKQKTGDTKGAETDFDRAKQLAPVQQQP
ncbi:MAG: tetratricopeptide repeat protein [Nitrosomonadales bacterium]|nr:tetratricopeptide repeat protein [Nitrosomonadales bacterium]